MSRSFALSLAAQFVIGAGLTNFRASNNTLVQMFVNDDLRGRVMSTYQLAAVGMTPIGALEVGYMGSHLGPMRTVVICGVVILLSGVVLLTRLKSVGHGRGAIIVYSLPDAHFVCSMLANRFQLKEPAYEILDLENRNRDRDVGCAAGPRACRHLANRSAHTNVEFTVRHMMISNVKGQFQKTSGTITADGNDPASAKIDATIDASSINTRVDKRDAHLKSPDISRRRKVPDDHFQIDQSRSRRSGQVESDGRPDAAWRDQAGRARGRKHRGRRFTIRWATCARARRRRRTSSAAISA